jgi:ubiquinone/menaquinone biosynthesis C-methylase UbiE
MPEVTREIPAVAAEARRVLKPGGRLAVIECKREESSIGPPMHLRLSPEGLEHQLSESGFRRTGLVDLGRLFLIHFE